MYNFDLILNEIGDSTIIIDRHVDELWVVVKSVKEAIDVFELFIASLDKSILNIFVPMLTFSIEWNVLDRRIWLTLQDIWYNENEPPSIWLFKRKYLNDYSWGWETYIREIDSKWLWYKVFYICHRNIYFVDSGEECRSQGIRIYW